MPAVRLSAGWVVPVDAPPIPAGAVLIGPDGFVERVGPDAEVPRPPGVPVADFPRAALLPGLVNAHTHLELTGLEGQVTDDDFTVWVGRLTALKQRRPLAEYLEAARRGVAECWAGGVTTVGDTGDRAVVLRALTEMGGSGVAYQEVFGPHPDQCETSLAGLQAAVAELRRFESARVRLGVSPHAPYTVSGALYRAAARWARSEGLPLAVHLAESSAETEFLRSGTGPFAEAWRRRDIPLPPGGRSPVRWLEEHGVLGPDTLCIHAVQVDREDVAHLAAAGAAVAHCPRANRRHGHGDAPLADYLAAGLRVGLGTDSVVSLAPLDLLAEARAARALARLDAGAAVELATLGGARTLGLAHEIGSLTPGKWGDAAVVAIPPGTDTPAEAVLAAERAQLLATYLGGREVFRRAW
ncbi:MAG TPA: amidohydrolase family protein [Gemmatimonadales bacterium]|nr:amidohydrolase family protein [Gemmatimonadales bacterium]